MMMVFYYQHNDLEDEWLLKNLHPSRVKPYDRTALICVNEGGYPSSPALLWKRCNTSVLMVLEEGDPGVTDDERM